MGAFQTILPRNSTSAERALEAAIIAPIEVDEGIDQIVTLKETPPDSFLLWLVWEYGLEELLPYIPDLRALIAQGLIWERIKGTPESLRMVFSWLHYGSPQVEEEEPLSAHWFEYMADPGGVPPRSDIEGLTRLAKITSPVGTRLSRLFHGYDVRRFILDRSDWGDLLSDNSGFYDPEFDIVLSFGHNFSSEARLDATNMIGSGQLSREILTHHIYEDRVVWDFHKFGDVPVLNYSAGTLRERENYSAAAVVGQYWTGLPWVAETWEKLGYFVRTEHHGDPA